MTIMEQIVVDLQNRVNTARPAGVPEFKRFFTWAIQPASLPFAAVYWADLNPVLSSKDGRSDPDRDALAYWELDVVFVLWEKGDGTDPPDKKLDPIIAWIGSVVLGKSVPGLYRVVKPGPMKPMPAQADYPYCRLLVGVRVKFTTSSTNLEAAA